MYTSRRCNCKCTDGLVAIYMKVTLSLMGLRCSAISLSFLQHRHTRREGGREGGKDGEVERAY